MKPRRLVLVCGVQGSGKSWVCRQLTGSYQYIAHDRCWRHADFPDGPDAGWDDADVKWGPPGSTSTHFEMLTAVGRHRDGRAILTECPFGERDLRDRLTLAGLEVVPVFVVEPIEVLEARYGAREGRPLPASARSRAAGLAGRAAAWGCFAGSSDTVLQHLKALALPGGGSVRFGLP